jgi:hypothetical protein
MEKEYIERNIKKLCESASVIKKCIDDNNFLCDILNELDKNYIRTIYRSEKSGPILDIRKEVAKTILLDEIDEVKLLEIIESNKTKSPGKITINNPYRILNPMINQLYSEYIDFMKDFGNLIKNKIGDCKMHIWDFDGARFQGQEWCCLLFYNKDLKTHSDGMQLWISFKDNLVEYGVCDHSKGNKEVDIVYPFDPILLPISDFNLDEFYQFIEDHKNVILNDINANTITSKNEDHTFISASIQVLKDFENKPMSAKEIWDYIEKLGIYKTTGKTPSASLNTILSGSSINSNNSNKSKRLIFECVGEKPIKYRLLNYTPKRVRESLIEDGFLTKEILIEILLKNNINIEI